MKLVSVIVTSFFLFSAFACEHETCPCKADIEKFCKEAKTHDEHVKCLDEHKSELSKECLENHKDCAQKKECPLHKKGKGKKQCKKEKQCPMSKKGEEKKAEEIKVEDKK